MVSVNRAGSETVILIKPNHSASWRQNLWLLAALAVPSLGAGVAFALLGAWPILPFASIELVALGGALYWVNWKLEYRHVIRFTNGSVVIDKGYFIPKRSWHFLREEAALRLIEDGGISEPSLAGLSVVYSGRGQLLGVLGLSISVWLLYWQLGSWEDVQIAEELGRIEQSEPEEVRALIERIKDRAEARPTNADYALLLGEYYLSGNEPAEALRYYERLIGAGATAPEILGKAAQAEFLASNRVLSRRARAWAEQALAVDPAQAAALATLGENILAKPRK